MEIDDLIKRLCVVISCIVDIVKWNIIVVFIDEDIFYRIVVVEGIKVYYNKLVDV